MRRGWAHIRRNVVAYLALFFALGGIAGAAAQPLLDSKDSVSSRHIEAGAVRGSEIDRGAVGEKDLARSVRARLSEVTSLPPDGEYSATSASGDTTVTIVVGDGVIEAMGLEGACDWPIAARGTYQVLSGADVLYSATGVDQLLAEGVVGDRSIVFKRIEVSNRCSVLGPLELGA
jgi:hypothetical protein